jgi:hypothetical protein
MSSGEWVHLNGAMIIDTLCEEFETWRQTLPESVVPKLEELSRPAGAGRTVRVTVKAPVREAEVTVWESGEADLLIGNMVTGEIEAIEHAELTTRFGARGLLDDLARAVGDVG